MNLDNLTTALSLSGGYSGITGGLFDLPEGVKAASPTPAPPTKANTCADCRHFPRCSWLLGRQGDEKECDWTPSRFVLAIPVVQKSGTFAHPAPDEHTFSWEDDKPCTYPCRDCGGELRSRWYSSPTSGLLGRHECVACPWRHTI